MSESSRSDIASASTSWNTEDATGGKRTLDTEGDSGEKARFYFGGLPPKFAFEGSAAGGRGPTAHRVPIPLQWPGGSKL